MHYYFKNVSVKPFSNQAIFFQCLDQKQCERLFSNAFFDILTKNNVSNFFQMTFFNVSKITTGKYVRFERFF